MRKSFVNGTGGASWRVYITGMPVNVDKRRNLETEGLNKEQVGYGRTRVLTEI